MTELPSPDSGDGASVPPPRPVAPELVEALTDEVREALESDAEVVLDTGDLQVFLGSGEPADSVVVMEVVRQVATSGGWDVFVFDYGARVRFSRRDGGGDPAPDRPAGEPAPAGPPP